MSPTIYRLPRVREVTGRSRSGLYADIKNGLFPHPVSIGARAVGWPDQEVASIVAVRIAGKEPDEIRDLVKQLESARQG